jgi:hypothetical protein
MLASAERLMAMPYEQATLDTEVLMKQVDGQLHSPTATASDKKRLKSLRERLFAHRARCQLSLFPEDLSAGDGAADLH